MIVNAVFIIWPVHLTQLSSAHHTHTEYTVSRVPVPHRLWIYATPVNGSTGPVGLHYTRTTCNAPMRPTSSPTPILRARNEFTYAVLNNWINSSNFARIAMKKRSLDLLQSSGCTFPRLVLNRSQNVEFPHDPHLFAKRWPKADIISSDMFGRLIISEAITEWFRRPFRRMFDSHGRWAELHRTVTVCRL